jgi:hypothetical protein
MKSWVCLRVSNLLEMAMMVLMKTNKTDRDFPLMSLAGGAWEKVLCQIVTDIFSFNEKSSLAVSYIG